LSVIVLSHLQAYLSGNAIDHLKATNTAENILLLAQLDLPQTIAHSLDKRGLPRFCRLTDEGIAAILLEDEMGKIDLNGADGPLLTALLEKLGQLSHENAVDVANTIVKFRTPVLARVQPREVANNTELSSFSLKNAPFESIFELDQISGISPDVLNKIIPFVTVYSHRNGFDPRQADEKLVDAIDPVTPAYQIQSTRQYYSLHVEFVTFRNGVSVRDLAVQLMPNEPVHRLQKWDGPERLSAAIKSYMDSPQLDLLPDCGYSP